MWPLVIAYELLGQPSALLTLQYLLYVCAEYVALLFIANVAQTDLNHTLR